LDRLHWLLLTAHQGRDAGLLGRRASMPSLLRLPGRTLLFQFRWRRGDGSRDRGASRRRRPNGLLARRGRLRRRRRGRRCDGRGRKRRRRRRRHYQQGRRPQCGGHGRPRGPRDALPNRCRVRIHLLCRPRLLQRSLWRDVQGMRYRDGAWHLHAGSVR
jgi:hypothetical protein